MKKLSPSSLFYKNWWFSFCVLFFLTNIQSFAQSSDKVLIADSSMNYPSLESMLALPYFEDKVVLVDFWYTSCPPCLEQFPHNPQLKNKYKNQDVAFLYICVPNSAKWKDNEKTWSGIIEKHDLTGVHIKVTNQFAEHFWESNKAHIEEDLLYAYPTYLLVNKQGQVVNYNTPRPSRKEHLYDAIDQLLIDE